jgi:hypothetical protein
MRAICPARERCDADPLSNNSVRETRSRAWAIFPTDARKDYRLRPDGLVRLLPPLQDN